MIAWVTKLLFCLMNKQLELRKLSSKFYKDYPSNLFPEIENKHGRPYIVLLVLINDLKFAIPLRTNIRHSYCYKFRTSDRKTESNTGIDYSKAVVISDDKYLGEETNINDKEYLELQQKFFFVIKQFKKYVSDYVAFKQQKSNVYIAKKFRYSTLKYFDEFILSNK